MNIPLKQQHLLVVRYQPLIFADFEMEPEKKEFLQELLQTPTFHILLLGDIGTGKTSLLQAIVREYYKDIPMEQYRDNVLSINSSKEQGIQYFRNEVKTFCQTHSCVPHHKKIIVLDDIDLVNEQSQQVFRNCMDKYKNNVHFIASCGNLQKVIESLQSRFIMLKLHPFQKDSLERIFRHIQSQEGIQITPEAEQFLITLSNHSVKVMINYLEKIKLIQEPITIDIVQQICTNIPFSLFDSFSHYLLSKNIPEAILLLLHIYDQGYSVMDILDQFFLFVKITPLFTDHVKYEMIPLICKYITIFYDIHEDEIELTLFSQELMDVMHQKTK